MTRCGGEEGGERRRVRGEGMKGRCEGTRRGGREGEVEGGEGKWVLEGEMERRETRKKIIIGAIFIFLAPQLLHPLHTQKTFFRVLNATFPA